MNIRIFNVVFGFLIIINTFLSVNQWSRFPLGNTTLEWVVDFGIIALAFWFKKKYFNPHNKSDYKIINFYFLWMIIGVVRGMFVADGYWEWKQWASASTALALPVFVYVFAYPSVLQKVIRKWIKYALTLFFIFFYWVLSPDGYHFYLGPVLFLSCFLPILNRKWQLIFIALLVLMLFADLGARSQVIKAAVAILISSAYIISRYLSRYLSIKILKITHWALYILPVVLLTLAITGVFNPFEALNKNSGKYVEKKVENGQLVEDDLSADTRSAIYEEVIKSAVKNDYILWGRTPARGNDSQTFGSLMAEDLKTGKFERHKNEVSFPNIFTWLGIVGMLLYCFIFLKASYLAVFKSRSIFMKLLGIFIAFHFCYGWVEDINNFDIMNISLWMVIAMAFSERFRAMSADNFKAWVNSLL